MPNVSRAILLGVTSLYPKTQSIEFSYPYDNGIRIIDWDDILGEDKVYYGDEIDLKFWSLLNLPFGVSSDSENPLTLQEGYLYKYYHKTKVFDVYDDNGTQIIHKTNVRTIAQMNIDFTIHKSHQFWIIASSNVGGHKFMFPAWLIRDRKPIDIEEALNGGVLNYYLADRVRPYLPNDIDNYAWSIKYLANYDDMFYRLAGHYDLKSFSEPKYTGVGEYEIDWTNNCPTNYFYMKEFYEFAVRRIKDVKEARLFALSLLYMQLGIGLYPDLMPVQRYDETQNNRPVYEPWLIWGFYKFLYNKRTTDWDEDAPIPYFDLSPMWG